MAKSSVKLAKIKIPGAVRKSPVMAFVNSPAGRLLIAESLTAALAVFAYKHANSDTGRRIKDGTRDAEAALRRNTTRLSQAFGEGVRAFRESLSRSNGYFEAEPDDALEAARKGSSSPSREGEMAEGL